MELKKTKSKILLHTCCAICGANLIKLLKKDFLPYIFFYNPNIHPKTEYEKRKESAKKLAQIYNIPFIEGHYRPKEWFKLTKGYENEPEGGKRCLICFKMRLLGAAKFAKDKKIKYFSTTLLTSPYKDEKIIGNIGKEIAKNFGEIKFLTLSDLKINKTINWQKTKILSKIYNFYHQKYCGCIFSMRDNPKTSKKATK